jgi:Uma2 family endonuclease
MSLISLPLLTDWKTSDEDSEQRLILTGISWNKYDKLLNDLTDNSLYRLTYLSGILEIMSPSRRHEMSKKNIARLLEIYLEIAEIDFWGLGSTTLKTQEKQAGKEPDEAYCLYTDKKIPDLVIEVIITSGSIKILEVYRRLEVPEVWLYQDDQLNIYSLKNNQYSLVNTSQLLPHLDLNLLTQFIDHPNPRMAIKEFRKLLENE